jgi:TPR repeat protein/Tfp pilus assembly protein PilF
VTNADAALSRPTSTLCLSSFRTRLRFLAIRSFFSPNSALQHAAVLVARGKQISAFGYYVRAARFGLKEGAYCVGRCYLDGAGVPSSQTKAVRWFQRAALRGHTEAQLLLASLSLCGVNERNFWPGKKPTSADLFLSEVASEPDRIAAVHWARMAADGGSAEGQAMLAFLLSSAPELSRNLNEVDHLYERSATKGCPQGLLGHGLALLRRSNDETSHSNAISFLSRAAEAGLPTALFVLGEVSLNGWCTPRDAPAAANYFRRAAEKGHRTAQNRWGMALLKGLGTSADPIEGETWLRRAALSGDPVAATSVGDLYAKGGDLPPNFAEAAVWYSRAAELGNAAAVYSLEQVHRDREYDSLYSDKAQKARSATDRTHFALIKPMSDARSFSTGGICEELMIADIDSNQNRDAFAERAYGKEPHGWRAGAKFVGANNCVAESKSKTVVGVVLRDAGGSMNPKTMEQVAPATSTGVTAHDANVRGYAGSLPSVEKNFINNSDVSNNQSSPPNSMGPLCGCGSGLRSMRCCEYRVDPSAPAPPGELAHLLIGRAAQALSAGDKEAAERHCIAALSILPLQIQALAILARVRRDAQDWRPATILFERIVSVAPNNFEAVHELTTLLFERGDLVAAERYARHSVRIAPKHSRSHNLMGMILTETQRPQTGEYHYRRALALSGQRDPILLANLAWNLKNQSKMEDARKLYVESHQKAPNVFQTLLGWGQLEEADGNFAAAASLLDRAAHIRQDAAALTVARAKLLAREGRTQAALDLLTAKDLQTTATDPAILLERGRTFDRLDRFDEAFSSFQEAKRVSREGTGRKYLDGQAKDIAGRLQQFFQRDRMSLMPQVRDQTTAAQPIFILGFPRSGTTLVEQILSNHSRIAGGGELPFVSKIAADLPSTLESPLNYPEALAELWMGDRQRGLETLRDSYHRLADVNVPIKPEVDWFTDKMPLNEMHMGLISMMFPKAPLIHVVRHPLDVVLSVFSHDLTHGYFCASQLETIAEHYVLVADLVAHYRSQMDLNYLSIRYEDLVDDLETCVAKMLRFIGVDFESGCLAFHKNRRVPQTPSYSQVAETLYDRSKYRHRMYASHLAPVIPILESTMDRLGYSP